MSDSLVKKNVYLDNAAATPLDSEVFKAMIPYFEGVFGNPSSLYQDGRIAYDALALARSKIAGVLEVVPSEIIFTGSGTESDNLAIIGLAEAYRQNGNHVIVSAIEHKAVLASAKKLEQSGYKVSYVQPDEFGVISPTAVTDLITPETILVSIMYANNEIGTIQPIAEIGKAIKNSKKVIKPPLFHSDACQAPEALPILPDSLNIDAMTLNSAKVYGPKGVGLLYLKDGLKLSPQIVGGGQELGLRAGTENVPLLVGFATALEMAVNSGKEESLRLRSLQTFFISEIKNRLPEAILNGHPTDRLPNNIHICIPAVEGESLVLLLDQSGISCATGSACSAGDLNPSHVLTAIGRSDEIIHGSLRFSFGRTTTKEDLAYTIETLVTAVKRLKSMSASTVSVVSKSKL